MDKIRILWADDEIDLLKPHVIFLEGKGYQVETSTNGGDALEMLHEAHYDIVFLDENMPGMSGIETLEQLKKDFPNLPVVMITKSEEESIMEDAIGSKIADYLIKPVNPKQILLSVKKNLDNKKLVNEKASHSYQQEFRNIGMELGERLDYRQWVDVYKKLTRWELELERTDDSGIMEVLRMQKQEANQLFARYIENNYVDWVRTDVDERPILSHTLLKEKVFPLLSEDRPVFFFLVDNIRYDQWKVLQPVIEQLYRVDKEDLYYSILPTTTQYARNSLFSGLMPLEIERKYPDYWVGESDEGTKNQYEKELLGEYLKRYGKQEIKYSYNKILNLTAGKKLVDNMANLLGNKLNVIVYNFVDMLSHARTEMDIIRELAGDEAAYRSLTLSWFEHSPLLDMLRYLADKDVRIVLTTDHGSVQVNDPVKVVGDRNTNTNLRYKTGKSLNYKKKDVYEVRDPHQIFLPRTNITSSYIFCRGTDFFAYPNNYNYYAGYYKNTFQHGGISMEEVLIPLVMLSAK